MRNRGKEEKITFKELLENYLKDSFYIKSGAKGLSISNNVNYRGGVKRVDCVPSEVGSINNDLSKKVFVFGSNKQTKNKTFDKIDNYFIILQYSFC